MENKPSPLDGLTIASPCSVSWDSMKGDERVRACAQCRLNVYNLSELSRTEAENLIRQKEGRLCVRFFRRADGTILTKDCPVGLRAARFKLVRLTASAFALVAVIVSGLGQRRRAAIAQAVMDAVFSQFMDQVAMMGAAPMYSTAGTPVFKDPAKKSQ